MTKPRSMMTPEEIERVRERRRAMAAESETQDFFTNA
jgi:hypothetical protein